MPSALRFALIILTCLGWLVAILDAIPWSGRAVSPELGLLAVAVGAVGTLASVIVRNGRPASELFAMGQQVGRHQVEQEYAAERIVRLDGHNKQRRPLRAVDDA